MLLIIWVTSFNQESIRDYFRTQHVYSFSLIGSISVILYNWKQQEQVYKMIRREIIELHRDNASL